MTGPTWVRETVPTEPARTPRLVSAGWLVGSSGEPMADRNLWKRKPNSDDLDLMACPSDIEVLEVFAAVPCEPSREVDEATLARKAWADYPGPITMVEPERFALSAADVPPVLQFKCIVFKGGEWMACEARDVADLTHGAEGFSVLDVSMTQEMFDALPEGQC